MSTSKRRSLLLIFLATLSLWAVSGKSQTTTPVVRVAKGSSSSGEGSDSLICRKPGIDGFDSAASAAKKRIGHGTTSDPNQTKVYITVQSGQLYLHSNFVTRGFENPTKIATSQWGLDLQNLAYNLIGPERYSGVSEAAFLTAFPKMHFFVEQKLFSDPSSRGLDFSGATNVEVIGTDGVARPSIEMQSSSLLGRRGQRLVRFGESLYAKVTDTNAPETFARLKRDKYDSTTIKLMSLVINSDTEKAIAQIPSSRVVNAGDKKLETLRESLSKQSGNIVFVLGHIENHEFVTLDAAGIEVSRIKLTELDQIAKAANVRLFPLGCESATLHGKGVATTFNTVDAVTHFSAALNATDWLNFYTTLSSPDLMLVLDSSIWDVDRSEKAVLTVHRRGSAEKPSGTITHYFAPGYSQPSSNASSGDDESPNYLLWAIGIGVVLYLGVKIIKRV